MSASGQNGASAGNAPGSGGNGHGVSLGAAVKRGQVKGYRSRPPKGQTPALPRQARPDRLLHPRNGEALVLRKPRDNGGLIQDKRRPRYWRALTPVLSPGEAVPERRLNGWLLVLEAKKIPYVFVPGGGYPSLYVPPLYEGVALHEIRAVERERPVPIFVPPARENFAGVLFFLFLLTIWHGLRWGWFSVHLPSPPFPFAAEDWAGRFGLDIYRTRSLHEWWRAITALTLHADDPHLLSNTVFGLFFFVPLCRRAGLGLGLALALAGGIFGNIGNALTREAHVISLGFSTALFAAMGSLCALSAADVVRHYLRFAHMDSVGGLSADRVGLIITLVRRLAIPLAAGMALLGILGGGGEVRTDYAAHIWGFCCGVVCTLATLPGERALFALDRAKQSAIQAALFLASLAIVTGAWAYALLG